MQGHENGPKHKARKVPTPQDVQEKKETVTAGVPSPPRLSAVACSNLCTVSWLGTKTLFIVYG